jgi:CheY-like chemotaxis protein
MTSDVDSMNKAGTDTTLLFVDDDSELLDLYARMYSSEYTVLTASGGRDALDKFGEHIDFVFVDREMPTMTGNELIQTLRERGYQTPIVVISGVDPEGDPIPGCEAYLRKPVTKEDVQTTITRHRS